jgi:hypothetical protein
MEASTRHWTPGLRGKDLITQEFAGSNEEPGTETSEAQTANQVLARTDADYHGAGA